MMNPVFLDGGVVAAAEVTYLVTAKLPPACIATIRSVCAIDRTSAIANKIEIGILDGVRRIPLASKAGSFAAGVSHTFEAPFCLMPGQAVYAMFDVPSADDKLELVAQGFVVCAECERDHHR